MCLQLPSKLHGVTFQKMVISVLIFSENSESRNLTGLLVKKSKVLNFVWGLHRLKRIVSLIMCYVRRWNLPHRRHRVCITKTNHLMLFVEIPLFIL